MAAVKRSGRLEITTKIGCKCNCVYCPQELLVFGYYNRPGIEKPDKIMTLETFQTCIDKLPSGTRIDFSGMSEPWLNKDCTKMVLYAYEKGFPIAVYSTLAGMRADDFEQIRDIPFEEFVVHIPDDKNNAHIDVTQEYTVLLEQVMAYQREDGRKLVTGVSCHAGIHPAVIKAVPEDFRLITEIHDRAGNVENAHAESKKNLGEIVCLNCGTGVHHNVLLPDGTVLLCCMDYGMKHVLGNLLLESYDEICQSEESERVRKGLKDGAADILCRNCVNARNIYEMYDEYELYRNWTKKLLISDAVMQKDVEVYREWISKLERQKKEMEGIYKEKINKLNKELRYSMEESEDRINRTLKQNVKLQEKCSSLEQNLESLGSSPFYKLADRTRRQ